MKGWKDIEIGKWGVREIDQENYRPWERWSNSKINR